MFKQYIQSSAGIIEVAASDTAITAVRFVDSAQHDVATSDITATACGQLAEYFSGLRTIFDLPLAPAGTPFQQKVWQALCDIPYGATCSYKDIAVAIDNPKGVRAVGLANGKNPIAIVIPCHRVIGANGKLTGYAGGLDRKATLLELEGAL